MKKIVFIVLALFAFVAQADNVITSKEYVDTQVGNLQEQIGANDANMVLTYTDTAGTLGEKKIYDSSDDYASQQDALVTAGAFNTAVQNALDSEFVCIDWLGDVHDNAHCLLYQIRPAYHPSKNLFDVSKVPNRGRIVHNSDGSLSVTSSSSSSANFTGKLLSQLAPSLVVGNKYTLSFDTTSIKYISMISASSSYHWENNTSITMTQDLLDMGVYLQCGVNKTCIIKNIQIEQGTVATPYQPYGENTYLPQGN